MAAAAVRDYQALHAGAGRPFASYDLFAPTFELSCLNRLQLRNNQQMVDLTDLAGSLQYAGLLDNPLVTEATD